MVVRIEYRGIPVELHGQMVGGAFAATGAKVTEVLGSSWATEYERVQRRTADLLRETPTHSTTLLGDLEWEATQWYVNQPTLAWRTVVGKTTHHYAYYCCNCGVPEGTTDVERIIDAADLNEDGVLWVCPTCGEYVEMAARTPVHRDERGKA